MKKILCSCFLFLCFGTYAQNVKVLDSIINKQKLDFDIVNNKPTGDGWNFLMKQYAENNYVGWGEYHNSPLISLLTTEALKVAAKNNYNAWAVEISPMAAAALENYIVDKVAYQNYRKANGAYQGKDFKQFTFIPFFSSSADSIMLLGGARP
jgi:hypothetical protein